MEAARHADGVERPEARRDGAAGRLRAAVAATRRDRVRTEWWVAGGALGVVALLGLAVAGRPDATGLDTVLFDVVTGSRSVVWRAATHLRYPTVVVALAGVTAAVALLRRRWRQAVVCLVGPPLALVAAESVVKPWVGRTLGGSLSYPSGSTVGAAAVATALVLAVPRRWRTPAAAVGAAYALWIAVAVVALRWHFPTDALGGLAFGVGAVVLLDVATLAVLRPSAARSRGRHVDRTVEGAPVSAPEEAVPREAAPGEQEAPGEGAAPGEQAPANG
jgi:undecaprenyl-diphosphatase